MDNWYFNSKMTSFWSCSVYGKFCLMQKTISFENKVTEKKKDCSAYGNILFNAKKKKKKNQLRIM